MANRARKSLSSKQLMEKIGLSDGQLDASFALSEEEADLTGNVGPLLLERYHQMMEVHHDLRPGMLVTWKPGLKNRRWPAVGGPAVILERLSSPLYDDPNEPGSTYFHEPLDLVLGLFPDDGNARGEFLVFHGNSLRYQPCTKQEN